MIHKSPSRFTMKEKFSRIAWNCSWFFVKYFPKQLSFFKVSILRLFGAKIGEKCLIDFGVKIWLPWNLKIGNYTAIGKNVEIYNYDMISIGSMTIISQYSYLITGTHDYTDPLMPLIWAPITLGSEVWVAAGCWIFPGVTIGDGAVIAARSNVTKNMPAWQVCVGSPCRPVKKRELK
jgi:putative colanic acid biosynthesis acetyltransferase WcaF